MGVQAWSFNRFTAEEAVEMAAHASSKYIEFYPRQKLRPGSDIGVGPDMGAEATQELEAQLAKYGVKPVAFGVTGIPPTRTRPEFCFDGRKGSA